ncbi:MAG: oligosaccharide flippase family protein, partial [Flavobacteriaceae bacterium]
VITKVNLVSSIISGTIAIYMAYTGLGVWALVGQTLIKSVMMALMIWLGLKWKPNWVFSKSSLKQLFSFGSNLLISSLLNTSVNKLYELVIPKVTAPGNLGYYTSGTRITDFIFGIMNAVLERVLLPGLASLQDQLEVLVKHTRSIIRATALLTVPIFLFLATIAEPLILILMSDKWLPAVPVMQIFCVARAITIISGINVNLLYVIGRTDLALKQQYAKLAIRVVLLIAALKFGIYYIALAELTSTAIHFFINTYYPGKIMKYGALNQLKDMFPVILSGAIMSLCVYLSVFWVQNDFIKLCIAPIVAIPIYFIFVRLFNVQELQMLISKVKGLKKT